MSEATTRIRRTFHYLTDSDFADDLPEALDEEEQENLIQTLARENGYRNMYYSMAMFWISILLTILYLPSLFRPAQTLLALLALTSLSSTALLLYKLLPGETSIPVLDNFFYSRPSGWKGVKSWQYPARTPLGDLLPYLNLVVSVLVVFVGWRVRVKAGEDVWVGCVYLPGGWYLVVLVAKVLMGSVDPERELGGLRYELRGA